MASNSETGHAVNISNYKLMIDICTSFGADYNPTNARLILATMTAQWTNADTAHTTLSNALAAAKGPINARKLAIAPLDKLITRVINGFAASGVDEEIIQDAKTLADDIRGMNAKKPKNLQPPPDPETNPEWVSQSHQGYVQRTTHFKNLIDLLTSAGWSPNETALNVATLGGLYTTLKGFNDNIGNILAPVKNALITRNQLLYQPTVGIIDVAAECKAYVKSVYGGQHAKTKLVTKIKFRDLSPTLILTQ